MSDEENSDPRSLGKEKQTEPRVTGTNPVTNYEALYAALAVENEKLRKENKTKDKQISAFRMREKNSKVTSQTTQKTETASAYTEPPAIATPEPPHTHTENEPLHKEPGPDDVVPEHLVPDWSMLCPECGKPNPNFKDETECRNCHAHTGSIETVKKLALDAEKRGDPTKVCPYCGTDKFKDLRP